MQTFLIIDVFAILHRAFHAIPPLTTKDGKLVNAVYGFASMLLNFNSEFQPSYFAACLDLPGKTFRNDLFEDYQSKRPKMKDELKGQIDTVKKLLKILGIKTFSHEGFEADDIIAALVARLKKEENLETVIVSGDRDLLQLVGVNTTVFLPIKGLSKGKRYFEKDVLEKLGVLPSQVCDLKALMGDASDNYPGVKGVGPKSAVGLIKEYGSLDNIYASLDQIKSDKLRNILTEGRKSAYNSYALALLREDLKITFKLADCIKEEWADLETEVFFDSLDFRSLIPRLNPYKKLANTLKIKKEKERIDKKESQVEQKKLF